MGENFHRDFWELNDLRLITNESHLYGLLYNPLKEDSIDGMYYKRNPLVDGVLDFDEVFVKSKIVDFLGGVYERSSRKELLVPLSGGVDSAVVAALAVETKLPVRSITVIDDFYSRKKDVEDAKLISNKLNIEHKIVDNSYIVAGIKGKYEREAAINMMMGVREATINVEGLKNNSLIPCAGNKSEVFGLSSLNSIVGECYPLVDLYKTQVYQLAKSLDLPEHIKSKPSHSGVNGWQDDETYWGFNFRSFDTFLCWVDEGVPVKTLANRIGVGNLERVEELVSHLKKEQARMQFPVCWLTQPQ